MNEAFTLCEAVCKLYMCLLDSVSWISPRPHRSAGWHEPPLFILKHQQDIKVSGQKQQQVTKIDTGAYPNNIPKDWIEYLGKLKLWECKILAGAPSILYIPKVLVSVPHIRDNATKKLPWLLPTHRSCVCVCLSHHRHCEAKNKSPQKAPCSLKKDCSDVTFSPEWESKNSLLTFCVLQLYIGKLCEGFQMITAGGTEFTLPCQPYNPTKSSALLNGRKPSPFQKGHM